MHREQHQVRVLDQLLHSLRELSDCSAVQDSMVRRDREIDGLSRHELILVLVPWCICVRFANSDDSNLRSQNSRHKVSTTDVTNWRNTKGWIRKIIGCQFVCCSSLNQLLQISVNLQDRFVLNRFDIGYGEAIFWVDSYREVMVPLDHVSLDKAIHVKVIVNLRVYDRVLSHSDRACFDEEGQHGQLWMLFFHFFT